MWFPEIAIVGGPLEQVHFYVRKLPSMREYGIFDDFG